jgi:hypothetical protein
MRFTILNRKGQMDRRLEIRTVVLVMIVTCAPALAAILLIAVSSEPDLAELNRVPQPDGAPAVADLARTIAGPLLLTAQG